MILILGLSTFVLSFVVMLLFKFAYELNKENTIYAKKLGKE